MLQAGARIGDEYLLLVTSRHEPATAESAYTGEAGVGINRPAPAPKASRSFCFPTGYVQCAVYVIQTLPTTPSGPRPTPDLPTQKSCRASRESYE